MDAWVLGGWMRIAVEGLDLTRQRTGMGRYVLNLLRGFAEVGSSNTYCIYCLPDSPEPGILNEACFVRRPISYLPLPAKRTLWEQVLLPLHVRRDGAQVLFCPSYTAPALTACSMVTAIHDAVYALPRSQLSPRETWAGKVFSALAARRAVRIVTPSRSSRRQVAVAYGIPDERIEVIPLASDPIFRPMSEGTRVVGELKARYGVGDRFVLYVGQILQRRHVPCLLEAFHEVHRIFPEYQLVLVGGNRMHPYVDLRSLIKRLDLEDVVVWEAYVPDEYLVSLYGAAQVFVYVSSQEGFGLPVLEAMACGCPVVTSNTSSLPEVAGEAAIQVAPGDVGVLAEALRRLLTDPALREDLARKGIERAAHFSWRNTAQRTLRVLEEAASVGG